MPAPTIATSYIIRTPDSLLSGRNGVAVGWIERVRVGGIIATDERRVRAGFDGSAARGGAWGRHIGAKTTRRRRGNDVAAFYGILRLTSSSDVHIMFGSARDCRIGL
jgi:hypothetical protein